MTKWKQDQTVRKLPYSPWGRGLESMEHHTQPPWLNCPSPHPFSPAPRGSPTGRKMRHSSPLAVDLIQYYEWIQTGLHWVDAHCQTVPDTCFTLLLQVLFRTPAQHSVSMQSDSDTMSLCSPEGFSASHHPDPYIGSD